MNGSGMPAGRRTLTIGTRGSKLALIQTGIVRDALLRVQPALDIKVEVITTRGDVVQDRPLSEIGGNGVFVRRIETALHEGRIDAAVHSAKDLPSALSPGMAIAAYLPRADARDVLVSRDAVSLMGLPAGARVGTGSPRRACQLKSQRPDLVFLDIRGNVDTRLRKLWEGEYDAIVLASAGLERLDLLDEVTEWLGIDAMIPAVGQGALAVEVRSDDQEVLELLQGLNDDETARAVRAERAFLSRVGGDCTLPVGAYATITGGRMTIRGMVGRPGGDFVRGLNEGPADDPDNVGADLARVLLDAAGETSARHPSPVPGYLPLQGKRIAETRASEQAGGLVERLRTLGAEVIECPAIAVVPPEDYASLDAAIERLAEGKYDWVIFTSVNGVSALMSALDARGANLGILGACRIAAIGPATGAALEQAGCKPDFVPDLYVAEAIVEQIGDVGGLRVLLPRADIARKALADGLRAKGAYVDEVAAYRTVPGQGSALLAERLRSGRVDAVTFTSSSTVRYTLDGLRAEGPGESEAIELLGRTSLVCIGPVTAATAREHGLRVAAVADEYTTEGLVRALVDLFDPSGKQEVNGDAGSK